MTCLIAFNLGYLTHPVGLSHLLTRQVVGVVVLALAVSEGTNFYHRHERLLLPLLVTTTILLVVFFDPFLVLWCRPAQGRPRLAGRGSAYFTCERPIPHAP